MEVVTEPDSSLHAEVRRLAKQEARRLVKKMLAKLERRYAKGKKPPKVPLMLAVSIAIVLSRPALIMSPCAASCARGDACCNGAREEG